MSDIVKTGQFRKVIFLSSRIGLRINDMILVIDAPTGSMMTPNGQVVNGFGFYIQLGTLPIE